MNKAIIFITGMSGTGKSSILEGLSNRGYNTIDTDYNRLSIQIFNPEQHEYEWIWDEDKINKIINEHNKGILFMSGTVSNQGKFYPCFNEIINLSAPIDIILERVQKRTTNPYGQSEEDRNEIIQNYQQFAAVIEKSSTKSFDTSTREMSSILDEIELLTQDLLK